MAAKLCPNPGCQKDTVHVGWAIIVSYLTGALALSIPLVRSVGGEVTGAINVAGLEFSFLTVILLVVWLLSGIVGAVERHSNIVLCVISSLGFPGLILTLLSLAGY